MRPALAAIVAIPSGVIFGVGSFVIALVAAPPACPRCTGPGPCALYACVFDVRGHVLAALMIGIVAAAIGYIVARQGTDSQMRH